MNIGELFSNTRDSCQLEPNRFVSTMVKIADAVFIPIGLLGLLATAICAFTIKPNASHLASNVLGIAFGGSGSFVTIILGLLAQHKLNSKEVDYLDEAEIRNACGLIGAKNTEPLALEETSALKPSAPDEPIGPIDSK